MDASEIRQRLLDYDENLDVRLRRMNDDEVQHLWESIKTDRRGFMVLLVDGDCLIPFFMHVNTPLDGDDPLNVQSFASESGFCEEFVAMLADEDSPETVVDQRIREVGTGMLEELRDVIDEQLQHLHEQNKEQK
ncbi:hypothetical protein CSQ85_12035 [Bifidobacterium rousetti]|uniref:hypothetical protein n=1 Tax=Bifidobacterium rousetti TaxID=2045439 RepID=UPI00123B7155|nr:hypothetical protein [Bifidobacterium rousetti]KAA8816147.1 hypothetical protein CSQ85_12035 [Bifidobacterium rousetti]